MLNFLIRRLGMLVGTMLAVSLLTFLLLEVNGDAVVVKVIGPYSTQEQREIWLEANGYNEPAAMRYVTWLWDVMRGDFGESIRYRAQVADVLWPRLANTAILAAVVFAIMIPLSITAGVIAGMNEGGVTDRIISTVSILTTSVPEFASAVFLAFLFVLTLGWFPATSTMSEGFEPMQLVMPAMVLVLFGFGYVARMMRASMSEVMHSNYIRTAMLRGLPFRRVITHHALRNALIAPFTVIILQINWLLSGVIVVEFFFAYRGFGALLLEASLTQDIRLLQACAMVSVVVAVSTQTIADIGYGFLNPRVRFT
ncbi:MAG: ABC transporter permease [Boseongicola sp. SB0677_bin_26]|nr:ABC transporter permease [Boseongicola sp. SB0665_bin_10]MYG26615.1 ABC transporter permease [Boseongicola sp. SB0677_bin_26]